MNYRESIQLSKQRGLSIVELLVALVISMLLLTGVVQVFFSSKQTYASNEAASRLQENGRFALEFIAQSARHAGYVEAANSMADTPSPIAAPGNAICIDSNTCSSDGDSNAQTLAARSDGISFALQPRIQNGARRDCIGASGSGASAINDTDIIINRFVIIDANPNNGELHPSLGCHSRNLRGSWVTGAAPQRLIDGIDALEVQYGISTTNDKSSVNQYVSATRVTQLGKWNEVLAIRIAVLANSIDPVDPPAPARQYVLLDAEPISFDDGKARQVFTTTFKLRNTF
ncbi:PilW family protein [Pseudomonas sp. NPDC077186]|uniref:PilW family protein n=1 Tax=Pseudomonas sp. NPDC077186 TaxID=3364421 RepID=UPI0037C96D69